MNIDKELEAVLQETTSDDVLRAELIKNVIYKEADLLANATNLVPTKNFGRLEAKWAYPEESMSGEYPVAEGATAALEQIDWVEFSESLECAETRFAITDEAKIRQVDNSQVEFSRRRASEALAKLKNSNVVSSLYAGAGHTGVGGTAVVYRDLITGMNQIFSASNIPAMEGFRCLVPAHKYGKLMDRVSGAASIMSNKDYIQQGFDIEFYPSREDELIGNEVALLDTYSDQTAFHGVLQTNKVPLVEEEREGRMQLYTVRQYFDTIVVPWSAGATTSNRIARIDVSSW